MKKVFAFISIILGVGLVSTAIYFLIEPTLSRSIGNMLAILAGILGGILVAGTGIKDWLELLKNSKKQESPIEIELSGDSPQIFTGEKSRNILTGGGDYIEKLEISFSTKHDSSVDRLDALEQALKVAEDVLVFLETQSKDYTESTIPAKLKLDILKKQEEIAVYKQQVNTLKKINKVSKDIDIENVRKIILSQDDINLLVSLIIASHRVETPLSRRNLLIAIGENPDEYLLSGINQIDFAQTLIYRLKQIGDGYVFERMIDEIAKFLSPAYMDRIFQARKILENSRDGFEFDDSEWSTPPSLGEVVDYMNNVPKNLIENHAQFLDKIGYYFLKTQSVDLNDEYIKAVEKLLNDLHLRGYQSKWPIELQTVIFDALCLAGALASTVKKYPNEARKEEFVGNAKKLGRILYQLHWRNQA